MSHIKRSRTDSARQCQTEAVTTFSTVSRARLRHASAEPQPGFTTEARASRAGKRELRRAAPPGRWRRAGVRRGPSAPGASAEAAPSRVRTLPGAAADARRRPRYRQAGGDPPSRSTRHRAMRKAAGWPVLRAGHRLAGQDHSQGRSLRSRRLLRNRRPLSSDLARQVLGTYRKDGGRVDSELPIADSPGRARCV